LLHKLIYRLFQKIHVGLV